MHATEDQRRAEVAGARRRDLERHFIGGKRLQAAPQPFELGGVDAGAGAAGIDEALIWIVVGEQQGAERAAFPPDRSTRPRQIPRGRGI
jgi:hypothetical protein